MSIVPEKYRGGYKGAQDWARDFIDSEVVEAVTREVPVKGEDGKPTGEVEVQTTRQTRTNLDSLFALAQANGIETAKYEEQRDRPNAVGRLKMTVSNSLRAAARKRHGLFNRDGEWIDAPAEFTEGHELKENRDGSRVVKEPSQPAPTEAEGEPQEA